MKVHILNRNEFDHLLVIGYASFANIEDDIHNCYISINGWDEKELSPDQTNYMNFWFDDVTEKDSIYNPNAILFDEEHAQRIIEFCDVNKDKKNLYIHCHAGMSRSGAVGVFANDYFNEEPYALFKARHPWIHPNPLVSRVLNKVLRNN